MLPTYGRGRTSTDGRGRGRGRQPSPGRGRGRFTERTTSNKKPQERELKFSPVNNIQGKGTVAPYATTKDAVIQHIRKNYKAGIDVGKSIEDGVKLDLLSMKPVRQLSTAEDDDKTIEQAGLDIEYQADYEEYRARTRELDQGLDKAYALIFSTYCSKIMQGRIEAHPDYETKLKNNPIAVLEAIKSLMHESVRSQYPPATITDALCRLINAKQWENEQIMDYVKRFKQLRDVAKSVMGDGFLKEYTENTAAYKKLTKFSEKKDMEDKAYAEWTTYLLLRGSDQNKYGNLMRNLIEQHTLGTDQFPKTIRMGTDVLSNHRFDPKYKETLKKKKAAPSSSAERTATPEGEQQDASFAQQGNTDVCYCCGVRGHRSPDCDKKNTIPRENWHVNRAMQGLQNTDTNQNASGNENEGSRTGGEPIQSTRPPSSLNRRS
jgi:hypothetical protein